MFTMAMIVTGYPGIRDCLNAYREVKGCDLWEFEEDKTKRKDSYWKIVEGKDRTIFNLKGRSLNTGLLPYASVIT